MKYSEKEINNALYRKAIGYEANEVVEEYSLGEDGDYKLSKKKVTKKHISPDLSAAKILLDKINSNHNIEIRDWDKEKLLKEKLKLIELLQKGDK